MGGGTVVDGRAALREVHALARCLQTAAAQHAEPQAELMALVWGPRFDRSHALELLAHPACSAAPAQAVAWLSVAADRFDALPAAAQARWRMRIQPRRQASYLPKSDNA
jgi:hypothetical protein